MKTPREFLLDRHETVESKLDAIRRQVLRAELEPERPAPAPSAFWVAVLWQQLIWPCRRVWVGLAAAWLVIAALQVLSNGVLSDSTARRASAPAPEIMALLQEQRLLRAELLGTVTLERPAAPAPVGRPRSAVAPQRDSAWRQIEVSLA